MDRLVSMCGVAGVFSSQPMESGVVERMLDSMAYRGPDHQKVVHFRGHYHLSLGQARLAIIDPDARAHQPFLDAKKNHCLSFNGEFYNFRRLRENLSESGLRFRTESDTEVALELIKQRGVDALNDLWGMFAGAYYDVRKESLLFFRDRFGKKPLYYYAQGSSIYFASEPKAILAVLDHRPELDVSALEAYFYLGYVPHERCVWKGMHQLAPGHALLLNSPRAGTPQRWYRPEIEPVRELDLESTFLDAVSLRMISDRPLGAFLSGGLDSSLVVAAMSRLSHHPVHTFCVRFRGPQSVDDADYAWRVAKHCQTHHEEIELDPTVLLDAVDDVLNHMDEPFGDASAIPSFVIAREARKQFTVALTGDGADEVFAGYRKYLGEHYLKCLGPYAWRRYLLRPLMRWLPENRSHWLGEKVRLMRRLLEGDAPRLRERHVNWLQKDIPGLKSLLAKRFGVDAVARVQAHLLATLPEDATLNDCLVFDQGLVLVDDMFVKVDRMSMKASLELRSPFVDHRLVEWANHLPLERKLRGTQRKRVLVERLGHLLPSEILHRPKSGFEMPLGAWMRGRLKCWTEERLFHYADNARWVDRDVLRQLWRAHLSGRRDFTEAIWFQVVFSSWLARWVEGSGRG